MISYFPSAGGLNSIAKKGDVVCLGVGALGSSTSSYYSNNNVLSMSSATEITMPKNCTYAYLPECTYVQGFMNEEILEEVSIPKCITIGSYAFQSCTQLKKVNAPKCTSIGQGAFNSCNNLQSLNFPECTDIGNLAFGSAVLHSFIFPKLTTIHSSAFYRASFNFSTNIIHSIISSIETYAFTLLDYSGTINLTASEITISNSAFYSATITGINIPNLSICNIGIFQSCKSLTDVNLPNVTIVYSTAFYGCTALQSITLPNCSLIYGPSTSTYNHGAFQNCTNLTTISLPNLQKFSGYKIFYGTNLQSVYLMGSSVCTLSTSTIFQNSTKIYVPSSLLTAYQSAVQWRTISSRIVGI